MLSAPSPELAGVFQRVYPWLTVLAGPVASAAYVRQWRPAARMEALLHLVHLVGLLGMLQLLTMHPEQRWVLLGLGTLQILTWLLAWGWGHTGPKATRDFSTPEAAIVAPEGSDHFLYANITTGLSFVALLIGALVLASETSVAGLSWIGAASLVALAVSAAAVYAVASLPNPLRTHPSDLLAIGNLLLGLYIAWSTRSLPWPDLSAVFSSIEIPWPRNRLLFMLTWILLVCLLLVAPVLIVVWSSRRDAQQSERMRIAVGAFLHLTLLALVLVVHAQQRWVEVITAAMKRSPKTPSIEPPKQGALSSYYLHPDYQT